MFAAAASRYFHRSAGGEWRVDAITLLEQIINLQQIRVNLNRSLYPKTRTASKTMSSKLLAWWLPRSFPHNSPLGIPQAEEYHPSARRSEVFVGITHGCITNGYRRKKPLGSGHGLMWYLKVWKQTLLMAVLDHVHQQYSSGLYNGLHCRALMHKVVK